MKAIDHFAMNRAIKSTILLTLAIIVGFMQYFNVKLIQDNFSKLIENGSIHMNASGMLAGVIFLSIPVIMLLCLSIINFVQAVKVYDTNFSNYKYMSNKLKIRSKVIDDFNKTYIILMPICMFTFVPSVLSGNTIFAILIILVTICMLLPLEFRINFLTQEKVNLRNHFIIEEYGINDGLDYICLLDGEENIDEDIMQFFKDEEEMESLKRFHEKTLTIEEIFNWNKDKDDE